MFAVSTNGNSPFTIAISEQRVIYPGPDAPFYSSNLRSALMTDFHSNELGLSLFEDVRPTRGRLYHAFN